jgi:hypothetical protein
MMSVLGHLMYLLWEVVSSYYSGNISIAAKAMEKISENKILLVAYLFT